MPTFDTTFRSIRKRAYLFSFAAFLAMAACVTLNSFAERAPAPNAKGTLEAGASSWYSAGLESFKSIFEAIGATLLIYAVLELKIDDLVKSSEVLRKLDEIRSAPGGENIIESLNRDIGAKPFVISSVDFTIFVNRGAYREDETPTFDLTFTKRESIAVLYDSYSTNEMMKVEQYAGDVSPWRLDTLKIDYGNNDVEDFSPPDEFVESVRYSVRARKRGDTYSQMVIRKREFLRGIMENHVFIATTNNVRITIDIDRGLCKNNKRYPINIWVAPGVMGCSASGVDNFKMISASKDNRLVYQYTIDRQFLPYQGFSFFLDV